MDYNENMKKNYQKELDQILEQLRGEPPRLLLHSCCAPCSSYVLEYLSQYFSITVYYYNPNIFPEEEYRKRVAEQRQFIHRFRTPKAVTFLEGVYEPDAFFSMAKGMEEIPEKGMRCRCCYQMRLEAAFQEAKRGSYDYVCSTLSISPMKNAAWLNEIGRELEEVYQISWLPSDFKKREGYKRSIRLSEEYDLYRQDYCGCIYSKKQREIEKKRNSTCHG